MKIARRSMLGALGGAAVIAATGPAFAARAGARDLALDDPRQRLRTYMQMRAALDERLVIGYLSGTYYGVVGAQMTPLWDVVGVTFARYRTRADGGYDGVSGEVSHFFDLESGLATGRFHNPYTGKVIIDPRTNLPPARILIRPTLEMGVAKPIPGVTFDHTIHPPEQRGDDVWISEFSQAAILAPGATKPFRYSERVTLHARTRELATPGAMRVRCETSFANVVDWRPWMEMGDRPGHLTAIGNGAYGVTLAHLPEKWIAATREKWPHLLEDPASLVDPLFKAG